MSQVDIQTDTEGRIIGLSGNFTKWTNSNGEEDHFAPDAVTITVPENMEAHVSASMTVDDWGYIDITPLSGGGSTIRAINLTTEVASPGPRGGHVRWSGQTNEAIVLQPGQYSIIIRQDNAPYGEAYASEAGTNVSFCQASVTIEYIAILAPAKTVSTNAQVVVVSGVYPLQMNRNVELLADVIGSGENTEITNLRIGNYDSTPVTAVSATGQLHQISIESLHAEFVTDTVVSSSTNTVARRARLFWTARIIDPLDTIAGADRIVSASTEGTNADPTFSTTLN